jgi:hypothetical protein
MQKIKKAIGFEVHLTKILHEVHYTLIIKIQIGPFILNFQEPPPYLAFDMTHIYTDLQHHSLNADGRKFLDIPVFHLKQKSMVFWVMTLWEDLEKCTVSIFRVVV